MLCLFHKFLSLVVNCSNFMIINRAVVGLGGSYVAIDWIPFFERSFLNSFCRLKVFMRDFKLSSGFWFDQASFIFFFVELNHQWCMGIQNVGTSSPIFLLFILPNIGSWSSQIYASLLFLFCSIIFDIISSQILASWRYGVLTYISNFIHFL